MWALFDFACEGKLLGSSRTFKQEYENPIVRVRTCLFYFAVRFLKEQLQSEKFVRSSGSSVYRYGRPYVLRGQTSAWQSYAKKGGLWTVYDKRCLTIQGIMAALKMVNLSPRDSKKKLGSVHFCFFVMVYIVQSTLLKARTHLWGWHAQKTDTYSRSLPIDLLRFRIPWRLVSVVSNCTLGRFGDAITSFIGCYEVAPDTGSKDPVVQLDTTPSQSAEPNGNMSTSQWQTLSTRRSRHSNWLLVLVVATLQ